MRLPSLAVIPRPEQSMEMQPDTLKEVLGELFALLETQETNSTAVLQLLKDQGIASDEKLSTYLDEAGKASNVKWRAARMRMEHLLTPIQKEKQDKDKSKQAQPKEALEGQRKEEATNAEADKPKDQGKTNGSEKTEERTEAKSGGNGDKSPEEKSDTDDGTSKKDQNASSKQTA
jgi:hypothetical protein